MSNIAKISSELKHQNKIVAFVGVNVVPLDSERTLKDQTVIVQNGNLILVEGNALQDVANVSKRVGVMVRGLWLSEAQLTEILKDLAG